MFPKHYFFTASTIAALALAPVFAQDEEVPSTPVEEPSWLDKLQANSLAQTLVGKVAIVTGGASGIGEAIVRTLAANGASVVIVDRNKTRGEHLSLELAEHQLPHLFVHTDLTDADQCHKAVTDTIDQFGKIDILVNDAGINDGVAIDATVEEFRQSLEANLVHYFTMLHYAARELRKTKGTVINIASKVALTGQGRTSGYAASKGGVLALTREWAAELSEDGVRVNAVVPAEVFTPQYERWIATFEDPKAKLNEIRGRIPLGKRMTTSQEIANTVAFLASDLASHTTGQFLFVDGGYTHLDRALN